MESVNDGTRTLSGMTTQMEGLGISGKPVDGETVGVETLSSQPDTAKADTGSDADDDATSDISCEDCKVLMSGRYGCGRVDEDDDGSFTDMTGREWPAIDKALAGTRRLIFSLRILSAGTDGQMHISPVAEGVTYDPEVGELRFQGIDDYDYFAKTFMQEQETGDTRRTRIEELAKEISMLENSIRTDVTRQKEKEKEKEKINEDAHSSTGQDREGKETVDSDPDSIPIAEQVDRYLDKVDELQMRLAWEVIVPWTTMGRTDESGMAGTILNHFHKASKQGTMDQTSTLNHRIGPHPANSNPAKTTFTPGSSSSPSSPGSEGKTPSVLLECPRVHDGGGVTFLADPSHIPHLASMWLDASARKLRKAADQAISHEAESGRKMEVDIAIDLAPTRRVFSSYDIPGEREDAQLWDPERPPKALFPAHASTSSNQSGS